MKYHIAYQTTPQTISSVSGRSAGWYPISVFISTQCKLLNSKMAVVFVLRNDLKHLFSAADSESNGAGLSSSFSSEFNFLPICTDAGNRE